MLPFLRPLAALALAAPLATAQSVITVDPGGGPGALTAAVQAAQPGDTLIVLPGVYNAPRIDKPLQVLGSGALGAVQVDGKTRIAGLSPGETVVLRGLALSSSGGENEATLHITSAAGSAWVEDCEVLGADFLTSASPFNSAVFVDGSRGTLAVTFVRTAMQSGAALGLFTPVKNNGLEVIDAHAFLYHCTLDGGMSGVGPGAALLQSGAVEVLAVGGDIRGVDGATQTGLTCPTDGGPAANVFGGVLRVLDANVSGGFPGGTIGVGNCDDTDPGPDFQFGSNGQLEVLSGDARSYEANAPVAVGETLTLEFDGNPGDLIFLGLSAGSTPAVFLPWNGALLGSGSPVVRFLGVVPASGSRDLDITLSDTGEDVLTIFSQAIFVDPSLELYLGPGSALSLLATAP